MGNSRIADFGTVITGSTPSSKNPELFGDVYPFITPTDIDSGRTVNTARKLSEAGYKKFHSLMLPPRSVCFVCIGATIGKICMPKEYSLTNQQINSIVVDTSRHNPYYVYYLLSTYAEKVASIAGGAATPIVNKTNFENIEAPMPSLFLQNKIAAILSAYDDLIENNLRRIKILEEMAQNLYREWFVNFRFPGHENTRFVDSHLGKIPEGWETVKVGELLKSTKRVAKIPKGKYLAIGPYPIIDQGKDFIGGYTYEEEAVIKSELPIIIFGDHTRALKFINFPFVRGADGTQLLKSNNDRMPMSLFYYTLLAIDLSNYAYARHFKFLKEEMVIMPDKNTVDSFNSFVEPILDLKIHLLVQVNQNLRQTRDLLLPKLISGEVDVSELEIKVPEEVAI